MNSAWRVCFWEWKSKENSSRHSRDPEAGGRAVRSQLCCWLTARPRANPSLLWTLMSLSVSWGWAGGQWTRCFLLFHWFSHWLREGLLGLLVCYSCIKIQFLCHTIYSLKRYNSRFLVYSWSCATITITNFRTFSSSPKEGPCSPGIDS